MIEMTKHEDFLCNFSPRALSALFERMPGYKCRIGCGLHFGSAIEGAIGSAKKIDATFVSHHVNRSETLESSTKEYGVSILMSQPFYELLSPEASMFKFVLGQLNIAPPCVKLIRVLTFFHRGTLSLSLSQGQGGQSQGRLAEGRHANIHLRCRPHRKLLGVPQQGEYAKEKTQAPQKNSLLACRALRRQHCP